MNKGHTVVFCHLRLSCECIIQRNVKTEISTYFSDSLIQRIKLKKERKLRPVQEIVMCSLRFKKFVICVSDTRKVKFFLVLKLAAML